MYALQLHRSRVGFCFGCAEKLLLQERDVIIAAQKLSIISPPLFQTFHDVAYRADEREDLLGAINEFLDDSMVLPPGEWDKKTLMPIMDMARQKQLRKRKKKKEEEEKREKSYLI